MDGTYEVMLDGQTLGTVELRREGLYYHLSCRCRMVDSQVHRLYADGEKIGVLLPKNGQLTMETRVAAKRLKPGCVFSLEERKGIFIPIRPGEAFAYLDKLRLGKLSFREGEPGLFLP